MNKIALLILPMLVAGSLPAMMQQTQKQADQVQQKEKQKNQKKPRWYSNDDKQPELPAADPETADLNAMLAVIMNQINQEHGAVTTMVETLKHKEHQRICPTCGRPAEVCGADKDRIAHGNIMLCGCPLCGGLQV